MVLFGFVVSAVARANAGNANRWAALARKEIEMELVIRCSVCGLKMIIEEIASSKTHAAVVMHVSPCPCNSRPTPLALDGGDSAASEQFPTPEVLSTLQGESTPAHRK